jgi:hypothetical protein
MVANQKIPAPDKSQNLVTQSVANKYINTPILQQAQVLHMYC